MKEGKGGTKTGNSRRKQKRKRKKSDEYNKENKRRKEKTTEAKSKINYENGKGKIYKRTEGKSVGKEERKGGRTNTERKEDKGLETVSRNEYNHCAGCGHNAIVPLSFWAPYCAETAFVPVSTAGAAGYHIPCMQLTAGQLRN